MMMNHGKYKTRFDVCIANGDYNAPRVYGPLFSYIDVSYYDMKAVDTDIIAPKMNFHITAKIEGFSSKGNYIILKPIETKLR